MNEKENNINYTAEDIQQYLSGKLTPLQMNAMEKAALDDPFLAEAIEGYEGMQHEDWKKQLAELKEGFTQQNTPVKVITLPKRTNWFKYAAAVLLIGGTTAISYWLINKKDDQQKIAQTVKATTADSIKAVSSNTETTFSNDVSKADVKTAPDKNDFLTTDKNAGVITEQIKADSNFIYKPAVQPPAAVAKANGEKVLEDVVVNQSAASSANAAAPSPVLNNSNTKEGYSYNKTSTRQEELKKTADEMRDKTSSKEEQQLNRNFIAQVVGPDNTPLPFANVNIKSENFGTYADVKGNFRLVSSDSLLTVEIKSAGYQSKLYTLKSNVAQNKIVLAEDDMALKKQTVISGNTAGRNTISRRATLLKDSVINVEPADGWDNYNTYVDNNIEIPDDILSKNIHGQVELSFDVKANGTITNIKVDKSLCDNCDEVAKRLIEQGPQWKVKKGRKGKAKVAVQF